MVPLPHTQHAPPPPPHNLAPLATYKGVAVVYALYINSPSFVAPLNQEFS
jgi:hypothetical protein